MNEVSELKISDVEGDSPAVKLIDEKLGTLSERAMVSAVEVTDLLLDVRALISKS